MTARAKQQLMALLMNVAAEYISQTEVISDEGATVSQAITYCDNLIDDAAGDHEKAKSIADRINNGQSVPDGWIPLETPIIAYALPMPVPRLGMHFGVTPNPGLLARTFTFGLEADGDVELTIYDVVGRLVAMPFSGVLEAGPHIIQWNGRGADLSQGLYFARLRTAARDEAIKLLVLGH